MYDGWWTMEDGWYMKAHGWWMVCHVWWTMDGVRRVTYDVWCVMHDNVQSCLRCTRKLQAVSGTIFNRLCASRQVGALRCSLQLSSTTEPFENMHESYTFEWEINIWLYIYTPAWPKCLHRRSTQETSGSASTCFAEAFRIRTDTRLDCRRHLYVSFFELALVSDEIKLRLSEQ